MHRLRIFFMILLILALSCHACAPARPKDPFAYAKEPFAASVRGTYTPAGDTAPRPFAATVTAGAPVDGDPTRRDLTVTFTAPDTLAGVTVTATLSPAPDEGYARTVTFTYPSDYGNIRVTAKGPEFDGFLRFAEALLPLGDVAKVSPKAADGSYTVICRARDREAVFTFSEEQDLPLRVTVTTPTESLSFTVTSQENGIPTP